MHRPLAVLAFLALSAAACGRSESTERGGSAGVAAAPPAAAAGPRAVAISVSDKGYEPASISARAGERLSLVFTRTSDVECGRYVKVPGVAGQTELPLGKAVAIATTMPEDGDLVFTCGMDMMRGVVTLAK